MTIPYLTQDELADWLKSNGCKVVDNSHFLTLDRVVMEKDGKTFPVHLERVNYFFKVVSICRGIGIAAPKDHQTCFDQWKEYKGRDSRESDQ